MIPWKLRRPFRLRTHDLCVATCRILHNPELSSSCPDFQLDWQSLLHSPRHTDAEASAERGSRLQDPRFSLNRNSLHPDEADSRSTRPKRYASLVKESLPEPWESKSGATGCAILHCSNCWMRDDGRREKRSLSLLSVRYES